MFKMLKQNNKTGLCKNDFHSDFIPLDTLKFFSCLLLSFLLLSLIYPVNAAGADLNSEYTDTTMPENYLYSSYSILLSKQYYAAGEMVNISIGDPIRDSDALPENIYLEIYSEEDPEYFYRYVDLQDDNILFINDLPGKYIVRLYASSGTIISGTLIQDDVLLSEKEFFIYAKEYDDCNVYSIGEPITIDLTQYYERLLSEGVANIEMIERIYLLHYDDYGNFDSELRYGDVLNNIVYFSASKSGTYKLLVNDIYLDCYTVTESSDATASLTNPAVVPSNAVSGNGAYTNVYTNTNPSVVDYIEGKILPDNILSYVIGSGSSENIYVSNYIDLSRYFEEKNHEYLVDSIGSWPKLSDDDSNALSGILMDNRIGGRPSVSVMGSDGRFQNAFIVLRNNNYRRYYEGSLLEINSRDIPLDAINHNVNRYQADLYFTNSTVSKIRFNDLDYSRGIDMDFEDMPVDRLIMKKDVHEDFIDVFAINPERIEFKDALVTFTAVGNALWKCKDYNFDARTCNGDFIKIMDMVPGNEYSFILTPEDPVFAQSSYLINPSFDINITSGWTTVQESGTPIFSWVASDSGRSGLAQIQATGPNKAWYGSYYQTFNLTIPAGTQLANLTFSAYWRISTYTAAEPGVVYFWIQNASNNVTSCSYQQSYSSTTSWAQIVLQTNGSNNCFLNNFTVNNNYNIRLRCYLDTLGGGGTKDVRCLWDDVNVTAYYIDIQSPAINSFSDVPDPVNYGSMINFTANVTDNIQVDKVWISINNTNYTMSYSGAGNIYYFDGFDTTIYPKLYSYTIYANDTSNNNVTTNGDFTINDPFNPRLYIMNPSSGIYSNLSNNYFYYNVSDESFIENCSLIVDGLIVYTNNSVQKDIEQSFNYTLAEGLHYWNITCYDNSTNKNSNTSIARNITIDTVRPSVSLDYPGNGAWISGKSSKIISFNYTPIDAYLNNCSLYGNFSAGGAWVLNQTNSTPINNSLNSFNMYLEDGAYLWNVICCDGASNCAFNDTNFTVYIDSTPPYWSNNITSPTSGVVWDIPQTYQFNITWNDLSNDISNVWIEDNFTGTLQNHSVMNIGNQYYYSIADLPAGIYNYRWYANDTLGNLNSTDYYVYIVNTAQSVVQLLLNGSDSDMDIGEGDSVNITASIITPATGYIELYEDGVMINSGNNQLVNITYYYMQQRYNITVVYPATQNYSSSYSTHFITVTDTMPPTVALGNPENNSWNPKTITFYYTPNDNIDIVNCTLIFDGEINETMGGIIGIENSFTLNVSDGLHNWTVGCIDSRGNYGQNDTVKYVRVDTLSPTQFYLSTPYNVTISNNNTPLLNWTQTLEDNFFNYTIQVDNNPNFLLLDYSYATSSIAETSYQVPAGNPWSGNTWYWRVIAYDLVDNNYTTGYYVYTVDTDPPVINILFPENEYYSKNLSLDFNFTLIDFTTINNCSLYIGGLLDQVNTSINKSVTQSFTKTFISEGTYNWSIECYDMASNKQSTTPRYLHIDQTPPTAFALVAPENNTISNNNTPLFSWSQTIDENFANYTIQLSDIQSFTYSNYTYASFDITNTTLQDITLSDTVWYWHVIAFDLAGNQYVAGYNIYEVDTLPPSEFSLVSPANMTSSNNTSPLLNWTQTYDLNFENYTVEVSDTVEFSYNNFTYINPGISNTSYQVNDWPMNTVWYWRVIAYDSSWDNYTTPYYRYTTDNSSPIISLISPPDDSLWNSSSLVQFKFNVSDVSDISNCSLIIDGVLENTLTEVYKDTDMIIADSLSNGLYTWSINCTDAAGYTGNSDTRTINVSVSLPSNRFWETSPSGTAAITAPANVNLSYVYDGVENTITQTITAGVDYNIANATITFNGSGFILYGGSLVNFSGVFYADSANRGRVNWGLYIQNSSGTFLICQTPGGTSGQLITTRRTKETEVSTCTTPLSDIRFNNGDSMILRVNIYTTSTIAYTHYIDNANPSFVQLDGYKLGVLNATLINTTDQQPGEGYEFMEQCNITCTDGYCLDTDVHYELNNSLTQNYTMIGTTGNIILNGSQTNPAVVGTINSTITVNASLFANTYSFNNSFRCYAESLYSNSTSATKNITVRDITPPGVGLISPGIISAADPGIIEFQYRPYDIRLSNCSIYTNMTGSWTPNQTNTTPVNDATNYFYINFTNYGQYLWNILCCDIAGNCAYNESNRTLNIAGDLAILPGDVYFSNDRPSEGESITVFATITNLANRTERDVLVRFYEGDPDSGGTPIGSDIYINITSLTDKTVNTSWIASKGIHEIYAKVDPLNSIVESDDNNNKAYNTTFISVWQVYYGNVSVVMQRLGDGNNSFINWSLETGFDGNIYIADIDSSVSWTTLEALTRDLYSATNPDTQNDFEDLDVCLGTELYIDNINSTYSLNGQPAMTSTYDIYTNLIENVPDAMSTNNTNFYSGILWDYSDSVDDYYSCEAIPSSREDVVFVTKINEGMEGANGIYDYEIRVPGGLGDYKGTDSSVALYYEIK